MRHLHPAPPCYATDLIAFRMKTAIPVPVHRQGAAGGQHSELLRLHRPVRRARSAVCRRERGLVVLGFPSNDFAQESGNNDQIAEFCQNTYGVKFPMFAKSHVAGAQASPFFLELAAQSGQAPRWNFYKYLIGRDGRLRTHFSLTAPDSKQLQHAV
jgi:hypothetical protein